MPAAAEQKGELAQHCPLCRSAIFGHVAIDQRAFAKGVPFASACLSSSLRLSETPFRGSKGKPGGKQHAVCSTACELEHLRTGRGDVNRILAALREFHARTPELVQRAFLFDRRAPP